jgi:hypothetical protein
MIAVDHCEADSHGFCLRAFDDREEFAVAAGAPYYFLSAHDWMWLRFLTLASCGRVWRGVVVGSARVNLSGICLCTSKLLERLSGLTNVLTRSYRGYRRSKENM